jgi:hypothetical protein
LEQLKNHENYNCRVTTDTGEEFLIYANWLHNNQMDNWKGWHCGAGATRLSIEENFDIYSAYCKNDYIGNALTGFELADYTICKLDRCDGCTDDLLVEKHAPDAV